MPFKKQPDLYNVWLNMKSRCRNPNNPHYKSYGGRGISVCERWMSSYQAFESDMGPRPKGFTLDRIDNDGDYAPENCKWSSRREQQRNRRVVRHVTIEGKSYLAVELAELAGIKTDAIIVRAEAGLPYSEVISPERRVYREGLALGGKASGERQKAKTHCPKGHPYSDENLRISKQGYRGCKTCHRERERLRQQARR